MWNVSGLVFTAILMVGMIMPDAAWVGYLSGSWGSADTVLTSGQKLARKKVRSKKKPKARARKTKIRKPKPRYTPRPTPRPTPQLAPAPQPTELSVPVGSSLGRTTRIEFDAQLIKGQTTKAGEVQILERKNVVLKSMVRRRTSFRDEIIRTVFPEK